MSEAPQPIAGLPSALGEWPQIERRLHGMKPMVFLDYDGTLTPIVERPEDAHLTEDMRGRVGRLASLCPVVIVSGRDASFVVGEVRLDDVFYLGSHGFEVVTPAGSALTLQRDGEFDRFLGPLDDAEVELAGLLAEVSGAHIERKKYAIAVHYRQAAGADVPVVERAVDTVLSRYPLLRKGLGKKVFELRPDIDWHKGRAVRWMLGALGANASDTLPFYIGDDVTDEDAFAEFADDGVTVFVGRDTRESAAKFRVQDIAEVGTLLSRIAEEIERRLP